MSPEEGSQNLDRISALNERVTKLEEGGKDVSKVRKILNNLEATLDSVEDMEKVQQAFDKFDNLLEKMETGPKKTMRKRSIKKKSKTPPEGIMEGNEAHSEPDEIERSTEPEIPPEEPEQPPAEDEPQEVPKEEEVDQTTEPELPPEEPERPLVETEPPAGPEEGQNKHEVDQTTEPELPPEEQEQHPENEAEKEEAEAPAEESEAENVPKMDIKNANTELKGINSMIKEVEELGGNVAPIQPHIDALKQARKAQDITNFDLYLKTSSDWLVQYLIVLRRAKIEEVLTSINSRISDFTKVDEEARIRAIQQSIDKMMIGFDDADLDTLGQILKDVTGIQGKMEKTFVVLAQDLTKLINESLEVIGSVLKEISTETDTSSLEEELKLVQEHLFNGEYIEARVKGQELLIKTIAERDSKEIKKLDSLLLSIEPLLERIENAGGPDSGVYRSLVEEKASLIERSKRDVKDALHMMEALLDRATRSAAEIEENHIRSLEVSIEKTRKEAISLSDTLHVEPILMILERAGSMVVEGHVEKTEVLLQKAVAAFNKLKGQRATEVAQFRIDELRDRMKTLGEKGVVVSPLELPLENAQKAVKEEDLERFEMIMSTIDEKLLFMRNEELKVDYQRALIKIINTIREIKADDQDVSDLEQEVEKFKSLYLERKYEEAVASAESLIDRLGGRKLYKVIDERKRIVEETLREAEGLLVDVSSPSEKLASATKLMDEKDYETALDLLIEAQVDLEERMTQRTFSLVENEIRDLVGECVKYSVDPGDHEGTISNAYSLADEEKFREAMELLSRFREKLSRKVSAHKVEDHMKRMTQLIKQGRSLGIQIAPFKASMTKSRVLLDAGDVDSAYQLISRQVETLDSTITSKRTLVSKMDKLRGNLLAQEGKLSRLERTGASVDEFRERVDLVKRLIEESDHEQAEKELVSMDQDINELLIAKPDQLRKEMVTTIMDEQPTRPLSIDRLQPVETPKMKELLLDPDKARTELFTLIPKIKVEITKLHSKGMDTDEYKRDISNIQNLVIKRQYLEAYKLGKDCYRKMTSS